MALVEYESKDRIGYVTLNRAEKRNALSQEMVAELLDTFNRAESDESVKVLVLRAKGEAFCAGADLAYLQKLQQFSLEENIADSMLLKDLFYKIYTLKKIVIAHVQGAALAGGCGLATVCDFAFAVPEAKFGYTEVRIGFIPAIVMIFLIRKVGEARAKQLLLTGTLVNATEAQDLGLITRVVDKDSIGSVVEKFASSLVSGNSAQSMEITKKMIGAVQDKTLGEALDFAARQNAHARATEDCKKGIDAFLNKRELKW